MRGLITTALLLLLLSAGTVGASYPKLEYYVTDQVGVLLLDDVYTIESVCLEVEEETGAQIAVLIVNSTSPDDIFTYTLKTFEETKLGQKGKDDGLLIVISVSTNEWRIEVGYGLEGVLPDILVNSIAQENLVPFLNESEYYSGIYYTMEAFGAVILEKYEGKPPKRDEPWYPIPCLPLLWWQLLIVIAIFVTVSILTKGRIFLFPFWLFGGKGGGGFGGGRSGGGGAGGRF